MCWQAFMRLASPHYSGQEIASPTKAVASYLETRGRARAGLGGSGVGVGERSEALANIKAM